MHRRWHIVLILFTFWLFGGTSFLSPLARRVLSTTTPQQLTHPIGLQELHELHLKAVMANTTLDYDVLASVVHEFFQSINDPALELHFKRFLQAKAQKCVVWVGGLFGGVVFVGKGCLYGQGLQCTVDSTETAHNKWFPYTNKNTRNRGHPTLEWGLDWLNTLLRVLLPVFVLSIAWRPRPPAHTTAAVPTTVVQPHKVRTKREAYVVEGASGSVLADKTGAVLWGGGSM